MAILGPGGVGGFLAAALERADHRVTVVAREETAAAIAAGGLTVESVRLGPLSARPEAAAALERESDVLFVAVKATGLAESLERVQAEPHLVVPLLNGLDHLHVLRERFGPRAVAATIRVESTRTAPTRIEQTSPFLLVELATSDPRMRGAIDHLAELLNEAGIPARVRESEPDVMWGKLVRLCALALTTTAFDKPLGPILSTPELRAEFEAAVREAAAVARADGADADPERTIADLDDAHPELDTSMHRDVVAGREPELDAIAGSVLRAAARHGLPCPAIERLAAMVPSPSR
ncbi:MAG: 2-dehydropantoate 2-reductase [Actinomycetota bacterium]|nr:2-dehydropantoate 2-reductase [Actinomycetota bacterium]